MGKKGKMDFGEWLGWIVIAIFVIVGAYAYFHNKGYF